MNNEHDTLAAIKQYLDTELLTWVMYLLSTSQPLGGRAAVVGHIKLIYNIYKLN